MANVTITFDDVVLAQARQEAERAGKSLSRYLADLVAVEQARLREERMAGMKAFFEVAKSVKLKGEAYKFNRDEIYDEAIFDTNVVIYGLDPRAPSKQARALAWLNEAAAANSLTISPQVCAEARSVAVRELKIKAEDAQRAILGLLPWCTAPYGADEIKAALALSAKWRLSWWDSLMIASSLAAGCTHFVTEDGQSAPAIEGLKIIDPFVVAPEDVLGAA